VWILVGFIVLFSLAFKKAVYLLGPIT